MSTDIKSDTFLAGGDASDEKGSIITSPLDASIAPIPYDEPSVKNGQNKPTTNYRFICTLIGIIRPRFKGSIHLAFLSHACFIVASLFYIALGVVHLSWFNDTKGKIPNDLMHKDDDQIWEDWANGSENEYIIDLREQHRLQTKMLYTIGAYFFVVVGVLDWMRFCDILNMFMILAGITGMISGISHSHSAIWDCVSVHLYFLEAINLLHRDHDYEGYPCFRLSDVCFLFGSLLDIANCYLGTVFGFSGIGLIYSDLVASFLWLGCAIIDLFAEFYFLRRHKEAGNCISCV
ncbi:hypothetical protein ACHAXS_000586 [Conticribra weissflogii]